MTRPGIELLSLGPLANTLLIRPIARFILVRGKIKIYYIRKVILSWSQLGAVHSSELRRRDGRLRIL